jgi:hypothetical protein
MKQLDVVQTNKVSGGFRTIEFKQTINPLHAVPSRCQEKFDDMADQLALSLRMGGSTTDQINNANAIIYNFMSGSCGEHYSHGYERVCY